MTVTGQKNLQSESDLELKPVPKRLSRRRPKVRRRSVGAPAGSWIRPGPGTPLVPWKFENGLSMEWPEVGRDGHQRVLSARELCGVLWRLHLPEATHATNGERNLSVAEKNGLGIEHSATQRSKAKELAQSPSVTYPRNGYTYKLEPLFEFPNTVLEGSTKWNPVHVKKSDEVEHVYGHSSRQSQLVHNNSAISAIKSQLEEAHEHIHELETEKRSSKKKLEHFLKELTERQATWRSREHEKIRAIVDDAKSDLRNERKNLQKLEIVNSKLVNELADAKLLAKRYMQDYEKERKAREMTEEVCDELAKEINEDKDEVEELKRESEKMREEVEEERRMLQMAEVWREERVQMKLNDAKAMIEERYTYMNKLAADIETYLNSRNSISIIEDANTVDAVEREIEHCDKVIDHNGDIEYGSGWETVSQIEDPGSSYSHEGSYPSVKNKFSEANGYEGTPVSEVLSAPKTHSKKVSAIARLWRSGSNNGNSFKIISVDGVNGRFSDNRISNGDIVSPDRWSLRGTQKSSPKIMLKQVLKQKI